MRGTYYTSQGTLKHPAKLQGKDLKNNTSMCVDG